MAIPTLPPVDVQLLSRDTFDYNGYGGSGTGYDHVSRFQSWCRRPGHTFRRSRLQNQVIIVSEYSAAPPFLHTSLTIIIAVSMWQLVNATDTATSKMPRGFNGYPSTANYCSTLSPRPANNQHPSYLSPYSHHPHPSRSPHTKYSLDASFGSSSKRQELLLKYSTVSLNLSPSSSRVSSSLSPNTNATISPHTYPFRTTHATGEHSQTQYY